VGLKLIFLVVSRAASLLRLAPGVVVEGLVRNQRHLMTVLRAYEDSYNTHRPHRTLNQAAPLRPLPHGITDLDHFNVLRHDRAGGVIPEYRLVA